MESLSRIVHRNYGWKGCDGTLCAISGVWNLPFDRDILDGMLATMGHRGPDGSGCYTCPQGALLHRRLAIMDPERGAQPMGITWQGEKFVLVYNGELYNTEEIRRELTALGHGFTETSDTEVVLHAYAQWREKCLDKLNGIFAFAVWEQNRERLFLARDRMGVKPLFYMLLDDGLLFASEIKTILSYPVVEPVLDAKGAAQVIMLGPGRIPGSGIIKGIRELEPGQMAVFEMGRLQIDTYWSLKDREITESFEEAVEQIRFLVLDAVKRQMVSDVPMGTFLSGGLDSSIISAICAGELEMRGEQLRTFSVDYENNHRYFVPGKFQPESDEAYIRIMSQKLNSHHALTTISSRELLDALEEAVIARDLPGMADVDASLLLFCRAVRTDVKMALSGECADEIFGGYPWFRDTEVDWGRGFPWAQNTQYRLSLIHPDIHSHLNPVELVEDAWSDNRRRTDVLPGCSEPERKARQMACLNQRWFMQTLLDRKDRMSMYSGLEVRVPFCDYRIAEYMYSIPMAWKDHEGREKGILRKAMEGILPREVLYRKKSPYPKTMDPAYAQALTARLKALLEEKEAPLFSLVQKERVKELIVSEPVWPWYGQLMRRPQLMAYLLQVNFWLERNNMEIAF